MYDYYENYYEPSATEEAMHEIENILKQGIKKEIMDELERLRKENAELKEFKDHMSAYKRELNSLKSDCARQIADANDKAKKLRIHELIGDNITVGYAVHIHNERPPKCDKCDHNRRVKFMSPLGREMSEDCMCAKYTTTYSVEEVELVKFTIYKQGGWPEKECLVKYYQHANTTYNDSENYNSYESISDIYKDNPFEEVNRYRTVFLDKDKCQEYCDWLNKQKKEN